VDFVQQTMFDYYNQRVMVESMNRCRYYRIVKDTKKRTWIHTDLSATNFPFGGILCLLYGLLIETNTSKPSNTGLQAVAGGLLHLTCSSLYLETQKSISSFTMSLSKHTYEKCCRYPFSMVVLD